MAAVRSGRIRLLAATATLVTAWLAAPHAVPLYDGIGIPDEPYRYVKPPAGYQQTPPPSSISVNLPAAKGTNTGALLVQTKEQSSQVGFYLIAGSLAGPAGTRTFTATITPEAPDASTPSGPVDGNVYRIAFLADGAPASLAPAAVGTLSYVQRATSAKIAAAKLMYRPAGGSWLELPDQKSGTDSFTAYLAGPGDYALVTAKAPASSSSRTLVIVVLVLVVVAMVGAVLLIRIARRASAQT